MLSKYYLFTNGIKYNEIYKCGKFYDDSNDELTISATVSIST